MRRSAAPSRKFKNQTAGQPTATSINESLIKTRESSKSTAVPNASRDTSQLLNLIFSNTPNNENREQKVEGVQGNTSNDRTYNICWAKKSMKKHKTWEGDGYLHVTGQTAIVKDLEGNVLGRLSKLKSAAFEDGQIIGVGGKEIQIIEETQNFGKENSSSGSNGERNNSPPRKKAKETPKYKLLSVSVEKSKKVSFKPLVLPNPPTEHQWKCNLNNAPITDISVDAFLCRALRAHQRDGVIFLYKSIMGFWDLSHRGAILADEMGLGKTLQCIALTWLLLKNGPYGGEPILKRILIVTPSSLTGNWKNEYIKWLGRERIRIFLVDSKNKAKDYVGMPNTPIFIISYDMYIRYHGDIEDVQFDLLICDEGHRLKNSNVKATTLLGNVPIRMRVILTGTPIQNDLLEFYTLANFVNPGVLGDYREYKKYYENPIVASRQPDVDDSVKLLGEQRALELNEIAGKFILRRTQDVIDKFLPTKTECVVFCKLTQKQNDLYVTYVDRWFENNSLALPTITALKKLCNHPTLLDPQSDEATYDEANKFQIVSAILQKAKAQNERVVLCSSYTQTLDLFEKFCKSNNYKCTRLDGSTPTNQRTEIVERFNTSRSTDSVFLLSAKAGGLGLNLTGASRLVLIDSDWNPAVDLQAMARIWRDGQKKSVVIYRLLTAGTIEEKIYQRQLSKVGLSSSVVDPYDTDSLKLSDEELKDLFSYPQDVCLTHKLLECDCAGDGTVPEKDQAPLVKIPERLCQLGPVDNDTKDSPNALKINQLMLWEHYDMIRDADMFNILGVELARQYITFMFVNKTLDTFSC